MVHKRRVVTVEERRARMVRRHHLGRTASDVTEAAGSLVGLHSSDAVSVFLAARARVGAFEPAALEGALYEDRSLGRVLGMRRTMFVLPVGLIPIVHAACTRSLAGRERKRTERFIEEAGIVKDGSRWLAKVETATLELLRAKGEATAAELSAELPALRRKIPVGAGKKWEGEIGVSTRVLFLLATDGKIVRARPRGTWVSTQYRWAPMDVWFGFDIDEMGSEAARRELARLWLASFGPGTLQDLKWWTGWTVAQTTEALSHAGAVEVEVEGGRGYLLPDDLDPVRTHRPRAALLPSLDPTVMGWYERDWYLGAHRSTLFDRNGNAGPTVWWAGRVVGGWAQRRDGEIVFRLLEKLDPAARRAIDAEARSLQAWADGIRVTPRFRTPLEKELTEQPA